MASAAAVEEMERLMSLTPADVKDECAKLPQAWTKKNGFDVGLDKRTCGKWIPGLFHVWLRQRGAKAMGLPLDWPHVHRGEHTPTTFTLDGHFFNLSDLLREDETKLDQPISARRSSVAPSVVAICVEMRVQRSRETVLLRRQPPTTQRPR
jgi:hypothetical protein